MCLYEVIVHLCLPVIIASQSLLSSSLSSLAMLMVVESYVGQGKPVLAMYQGTVLLNQLRKI